MSEKLSGRLLLSITAAVIATTGLATAAVGQPQTALSQTFQPVASTSILADDALAGLTIKGRASKTGYSRAQFGTAWADVDHNGCDTREDILRRDLTTTMLQANGCIVVSGVLADPYTGSSINFARGARTSSQVPIDHVVPLADAWVKGAQKLTKATRTRFANDPLNLLATTLSMNDQKGSSDAASWLPPLKAERCSYVSRQIAVKRTYQLWITRAEHTAMARILSSCPAQLLPQPGQVSVPPVVPKPTATPSTSPTPTQTPEPTATSTPEPTATPTSTPSATPSSGLDPRFGTCREARAAGYGPYVAGRDPEYSWYHDADHDGVVCE